MQIFALNQCTEAAEPCGPMRERQNKAEEEGNPEGGLEVSINLDTRDLSDTGPQDR